MNTKKILLAAFLIILSPCIWAQKGINPKKIKIDYPSAEDNIKKAFDSAPLSMSVSSVVAPEDGSITTAKWFFNTNEHGGFTARDISKALKKTGITPVQVDMKGFAQDQMIFNTRGGFKSQPRIWAVSFSTPSLSNAMYYKDGIRVIDEKNAAKLSKERHQMRSLFIEGGAMVTGRFAPGDPATTYAIVNNDLLTNMPYTDYCQNTTFDKFKKENNEDAVCATPLTREEIIERAAADLGISKDLLVIVDIGSHIDIELFPLPGGKILVNDQNLVIQLLADNNLLPEKYNIKEDAAEIQNKIREALLDFNKKSKKYKFTIIPAAGKFDIIKFPLNSQLDWDSGKEFRVNFFNGVNLKTPAAQRIVLTNKALLVDRRVDYIFDRKLGHPVPKESLLEQERLPALEHYWANLLALHDNIKPANVKFIGHMHGNNSAGINCLGAVCPI